jgi:DNA-binding beta-propeller fold protein YncE
MKGNRREFLHGMGGAASVVALGSIGSAFAAVGADRLIVVTNGGGQGIPPSMSLIDPDTLEVLLTVSAAASFSLPATRWAYARDIIWGGTGQKISGISLATGAEVAAVETASKQNYTELTPDGRFVLSAARFEDKLYKVDARPDVANSERVVEVAEHYKGSNPCDMTILADGSYAFTPDRLGETVSVFRVNPLTKVATVPLERLGEAPLEPYMATVSPRGDYLLVENARKPGSESILDVRDPEHPAEVLRLNQADGLGDTPITSEITPDGRFGVVICRGSSELTVIDLDALAVHGRVALPEKSNPITGAFTPEGDRFFVPLPGRDAVAVVSVPQFEVIKLVPVGTRPLGAVYLESPVPQRQGMLTPLGTALMAGREWPATCPDRCCGTV